MSALLDKYADDGLKELDDTRVLELKPFAEMGSPLKLVKAFGGKKGYEMAIRELEQELYA